MRIKKMTCIAIVSVLIIIIHNNEAYSARKQLNAPPLLSFNPEEHLDEGYKQRLKEIEDELIKKGETKAVEKIKGIKKTLRKKKAKEKLKEVEKEIEKYKNIDREHYEKLREKIKEIREDIESRRFNKYKEGVDFEVDEANRQYIFRWDEKGKEVVKRTPFVPEMRLIVEAEYIPRQIEGKEVMMYRYWVENQKESKASFYKLYLESKFPQDYIKEKIMGRYGSMSRDVLKYDNIKQSLGYPGGYLNYFRFWNYDYIKDIVIDYHPGQKMEYPFELEDIEGSLPGIIECYVGLSPLDFNPDAGISAEEDPEMAVDILSAKEHGPYRYKYWGKTIGPVPIPEPFDRGEFIEQIIAYNKEAIEEGWIEGKEAVRLIMDGLEKIKADPEDKEEITRILAGIENYKKKGEILSEAYALLRYNLEYLMKK